VVRSYAREKGRKSTPAYVCQNPVGGKGASRSDSAVAGNTNARTVFRSGRLRDDRSSAPFSSQGPLAPSCDVRGLRFSPNHGHKPPSVSFCY